MTSVNKLNNNNNNKSMSSISDINLNLLPLNDLKCVKNLNEIKFILNIINSNINLNLIKYQILSSQEQLLSIKERENYFYLIPHYQGYNFLLVLTKYENYNKIYLVLKKDLKINYTENINVNIFEIRLKNNKLGINIFNNFSIFEGKLNYKKDEWFFMIYDAYYILGKNLLSEKIDNKIDSINNIVNNLKDNIEIILLRIAKFYKLSEIQDLVYNKIRHTDFKINGLIFWPTISGKQYIYICDSEFDKLKMSNEPNISLHNTNISIENQNIDEIQDLVIQKTCQVDVYDVLNLNKTLRYGIAFIPNIKVSHKLREIFSIEDQKIFKCKFNTKFNKWTILNM